MLQQICNNHICYFSAGRKLADGKAINGKGRLTNIRIGIFQNIYGHVIRNNKGNSTAMEKGVRASLKHYCSTVEKPQHEDCPEGYTSWCSYQRDKATGKQTHRLVKNPIPVCIQTLIEPLFNKLSDKTFLEGCKNLLSSNSNEMYHHVLWNLAPKEQYNSAQEIELATNLSLCMFNSGFLWTYAELMTKCNLEVTPETKSIFRKIDYNRMLMSDYRSKETTKEHRKKTRTKKNKLADGFVRSEGVHYSSGAFHIDPKQKKQKRKK